MDQKYVCEVCGWEYDPAKGDPENGIEPGTSFADLHARRMAILRQRAGKDSFSTVL